MATVIVTRRGLDWKIDQPEFFIHRDLGPHTVVPVYAPGIIEPRVVTIFTRARNSVELPECPPCSDVERLHETFRVVVRARRRSVSECATDNDDVADHDGGGMCAQFASGQIDAPSFPVDSGCFQINTAVHAKGRHPLTSFGVECDEAKPDGDVEDSFLASFGAVGPIG